MFYQIRTIVVGIVSPSDDPILGPAVELARRCNASLHVVHSTEVSDLRWSENPPTPPLEGMGDEARYHVLPGAPGVGILEIARIVEADLIVVGSSRRGRVAGALFGTTARRVVRHADAPVLTLRGHVSQQVFRVLLTTDLSPLSASVHEVGLDIVETLFPSAELAAREIEVVFDDPSLVPPLRTTTVTDVVDRELADFVTARRPRAVRVERGIRFGDPVEEILAEAESWRSDLIVLGTHGRTGASRVLLGSTAEGVLSRAPGSTLVIPRSVASRMALPVRASVMTPVG